MARKKSGLSQVNAWIKAKSSSSSASSIGSRRKESTSTSVGNLTNEFLDFLDQTPSPWHVAAVSKKKLLQSGFVELKESQDWNIKPNMKFFFQREALTAAFVVGSDWKPGNEFCLVAGHIDSPGLRLRQKSDISHDGSIKISMEMYGGGLWHTWFDRELTLSGLAIIRTPSGQMEKKLVTLDRPVGSIPNLCVHLGVDELKDGFKPRKEDHMNMILGRSKTSDPKKEYPTSLIGKHPQELLLLIAQHLNVQAADIVDLDLCFSTYQNANVGGINDEYIYSGRLDNLTTCYTALKALTSADFSANKTA